MREEESNLDSTTAPLADFSQVPNTYRSQMEPTLNMQSQQESTTNVEDMVNNETESYGGKIDSQSIKSMSVNKFGITSE